ncbi:hypothetical protein [Methanosarcina sp.]|uniref:hypothetical protein n=1 Tax=Methanosarcina sp. TaxID=2213 RepID=UPI003C788933
MLSFSYISGLHAENPGVITGLFKKGLIANLFKKSLIANLFGKGLIENPWQRRDQTAQRKPFPKRFDRKPLATA